MTNKEKLKEKLIQYPSYNKKGVAWLADAFEVEPEDVRDVLTELKGSKKSIDIKSEDDNMIMKGKKQWQNARGEWLSSFQYVADAPQSQTIQDFEINLLEKISKISPHKSKKQYSLNGEISLVINATDLHLDQRGNDTIQDRSIILKDKISTILERTAHLKLGEIVLIFNGDTFNSENNTQKTVKGTVQYNSIKWSEAFTHATNLIVELLEILSSYAPVKFYNIGGNHDNTTAWMLGQVIKAYYTNNTNITTFVEDKQFKYYKWGCNSIMMEHGELKPSDYPLIFATEQPSLFAETTTHEVLLGHQHKQSIHEFRGVVVRYLPSLVESSEWAETMGYKQRQAIQGLLYHKIEGFYGLIESSK